jgi:hypothetical protein
MRRMRRLTRSTFRLAASLAPRPADDEEDLSLLDPRRLARAALGAARHGAERLDVAWRGPERVGPAYVELENKVRAFHFFDTVARVLELDEAPLEPARAIADAERRLGHEPSVWATEGIGYEMFDRRHEAGRPTQGLLDGPGDGVPRGSWTTLHTGMGMALADHSLERLGDLRGAGLRPALQDYVETCRAASRPGYEEMAFEPLGLVARLLDASLVPEIARALDGIAGPWRELFWHGVGRGLYFLPANAPPTRSAPWAGLEDCRREPPDERGRGSAASGFSWALTLVNLRHPAVVERFLAHHAAPGRPGDPVAEGVVSALLLWHEASGGEAELRAFLDHAPAPERSSLWDEVVRVPFEQGRRLGGEGTREPRRLSGLFRYRGAFPG